MKKLFYFAIVAMTACSSPKVDCKAELDRIVNEYEAIFADATLTEDDKFDKAGALLLDEYSKHKDDSVGLELFTPIIVNFVDEPKAVELWNEASEMVKSDKNIESRMTAIIKASETAPGKKCKDVTGVDAISGETLNLSSFIGGEKPTIVDFWASWCRPCRNEIANNLIPLFKTGKVNIVGIAVWEKSVEDTRSAMSELGLTWPVIFAGGREDSPAVEFGVSGIPTLLLVAPDGTILARGHSIEEFSNKL